eukprot:14815584-Alexandrium_andersonii.AAC.1
MAELVQAAEGAPQGPMRRAPSASESPARERWQGSPAELADCLDPVVGPKGRVWIRYGEAAKKDQAR